jgi:hypothetical protein
MHLAWNHPTVATETPLEEWFVRAYELDWCSEVYQRGVQSHLALRVAILSLGETLA